MAKLDQETKARRKQAGQRPILEVIADIKEKRPDILDNCRTVGKWTWATFSEKPLPEVIEYLKDAGFYYNRRRSVWQHCGGFYRSRHPKIDPRMKYGSTKITLEDDKQAA